MAVLISDIDQENISFVFIHVGLRPRCGSLEAARSIASPAPAREASLTRAAGLWRENAALRERLSALSSAILHVSASLDLDTVLAELVQALPPSGLGPLNS